MIYTVLYLHVHTGSKLALRSEPDHHVTVVMFTLQKDTGTQVLYTVQVLMMQPQ